MIRDITRFLTKMWINEL